ncbi:hypothetical protein ACIHFD_49900 [Nonomuraea sp. NPDC051941]|uniref:hypothetical protein n=1 Tax=Nonomuraea sp. NPDC051941 TaxID=3364373 RepID=UPI0037CC7B39
MRDTFSQAVAAHGVPVPTLTDNGKTMKSVVDAVTGELLRELTIDPSRDYQPQANPKTTKSPNPQVRGFSMS